MPLPLSRWRRHVLLRSLWSQRRQQRRRGSLRTRAARLAAWPIRTSSFERGAGWGC